MRRIAVRSIGNHDKSKQEVMHSLLQEVMLHSDFAHIYIHLDKHSAREINATGEEQSCYPHIFDLYAKREEPEWQLSFVNYARKYECRKGNLSTWTKRTVVMTYPARTSEPSSVNYNRYCKYFLVKHKPWRGEVQDAWEGQITAADEDNIHLTDHTNPIC
jgi:hypothetical protein